MMAASHRNGVFILPTKHHKKGGEASGLDTVFLSYNCFLLATSIRPAAREMEDDEDQEVDEDAIRNRFFGLECLHLAEGNSFLFDNIDSIVALSRESNVIKEVELYPFDSDAGDYKFWDKVGQIVGNLMELEMLGINLRPYIESDDDDNDDGDAPDWEILTRILPYLRRNVELSSSTENYDVFPDEIDGLAKVIHGHPMISGFSSEMCLTLGNLGPWCSALATLPSLESLIFGLQEPHSDFACLEPSTKIALTELLRVPALRSVLFYGFHFTDALCHATANALEEGSSIIDITFDNHCSFPDGGRAIIANALKKNASVTNIRFLDDCDEPLCATLASVLLSNSTLQNLTVHNATLDNGEWFSSIFLSLGMNTTLKSLTTKIGDKFGDELCTAIRSGLEKNTTLEEMSFYNMDLSDDAGAVSGRNALSFLRANTTLKSLTVVFHPLTEESDVSAFRLEAVKLIEDHPFLVSLVVTTGYGINFEELFALVSALQRNTTLKTLGFQFSDENSLYRFSGESLHLTDDEVNKLVSILRKNYGLECLVPDIRCTDPRIVKAIFRLNGAGRRYLIEDGSSISKGVDVLSAVNDQIDCVFLHLLENPGLCNRRAVDATTKSRRPGVNLDESSGSGK
jgi:hypothetical protein